MWDLLILFFLVIVLYKGLRIKQIRPIYNAVMLLILIPVMIFCSLVGIKISIGKEDKDDNENNLPM